MAKIPCEIIRDLLPLYQDDICSEKSRNAIEEHIKECPGEWFWLHNRWKK